MPTRRRLESTSVRLSEVLHACPALMDCLARWQLTTALVSRACLEAVRRWSLQQRRFGCPEPSLRMSLREGVSTPALLAFLRAGGSPPAAVRDWDERLLQCVAYYGHTDTVRELLRRRSRLVWNPGPGVPMVWAVLGRAPLALLLLLREAGCAVPELASAMLRDCGDVAALEALDKPVDAFVAAAGAGDAAGMRRLRPTGSEQKWAAHTALIKASRAGRVCVLEGMPTRGVWRQYTDGGPPAPMPWVQLWKHREVWISAACAANASAVYDFLLERVFKPGEEARLWASDWHLCALKAAAGRGNTGALDWLLAHRAVRLSHNVPPEDAAEACLFAASAGHLAPLRWLLARAGAAWVRAALEPSSVLDHACARAPVAALAWLQAAGAPLGVHGARNAARHGNVDAVRWALAALAASRRETWSLAAVAASRGHVRVIAELRPALAALDNLEAAAVAAHQGEVARWLRWWRANGAAAVPAAEPSPWRASDMRRPWSFDTQTPAEALAGASHEFFTTRMFRGGVQRAYTPLAGRGRVWGWTAQFPEAAVLHYRWMTAPA
jgi:hypothetical protein